MDLSAETPSLSADILVCRVRVSCDTDRDDDRDDSRRDDERDNDDEDAA